ERTLRDDLLLLAKVLGTAAAPIVLVATEPDIGTTLVFIFITASMLLISGIRWRLLLALALTGILVLSTLTLIYVLFPSFELFQKLFGHVEPRINGWLYPEIYSSDESFQLLRSLKAIGSGQLYGKGFEGVHVNLPVAYSDFIFPVIAEEFGFLGASVVISLFFLLIYRIIYP